MKRFFPIFLFLFSISLAQLKAQEVIDYNGNVDTLQFNYNLTKSDNIQWIENELMYLHIIAVKQTLYSISKLYNAPINEILKINKLDSADDIKAGQLLLIPAKDVDKNKFPPKNNEHKLQSETIINSETIVSLSQDTVNYIYVYVQPKETLYHLSNKYEVSIEEIKTANNGLLEGLKAFTTIKIPKKKKEETTVQLIEVSIPDTDDNIVTTEISDSTNFIEHKVKPRETLYQIAKEYSVTPEDIIKYNPKAAKKIKRNQILLIPIYKEVKEEEHIETIPKTNEESILDEPYSFDIEQLPIVKSHKKFKIALLLPLYLEEDNTLTIDELTGKVVSGSVKPFRFIQFYQGAKLALDSLATLGMNVELQIFDVDEGYIKAQRLVNSNALKDFDLIIGPLYKQSYNIICNYVSKYGIPIVNPTMESRDNSCEYDKSFKLTVDNTTKLRYIANYILVNYPNANIVFYYQKTPTEVQKAEMEYLQNRLNKAIPERIKYSNIDLYNLIVEQSASDTALKEGQLFKNIYLENVLISKDQLIENPADYTYVNNSIKIFDYSVNGVAGYSKFLTPARQNVVISFTNDNSGIVDNLSRLNSLSGKYDIHLFGNEYWLMSELDYQSLRNVDFHLCSNRLINYHDEKVKEFIDKFSHVFISEPGRYAFLGFDTFYYFGKLLFLFDNDFYKYISAVKYNGLEYSMFFNKIIEYKGFENFSASIYEIQNYQWKLLPSDDYIWNTISIDLEDIK
ncbi:LysM peptidoglycan-binding domain-containing protein [Bacteroidales bacterium OttesenSCG-928-K03]|nr:LysM peptidoglycan-binding domain-containing protein [Bacteroidales bacterium OttesenSCG-928-L14]MDL2242853.1 LysM peptidoglycan-binding domain-containing protein [Bacteroidales bacterium OttesenSCG-928-K03]